MSTPPERAPTEPVTPVAATAPTPSGSGRPRSQHDPVARIALLVIAAVMVIMLLLVLGGYHFNVTTGKHKGGRGAGGGGGHHHTPKVTHHVTP